MAPDKKKKRKERAAKDVVAVIVMACSYVSQQLVAKQKANIF